jgi:hypothetical protein
MVPYSKAHSKGKVLGNVLGLDEWHLPICYQNPPFSWENICTKSGMCCFSSKGKVHKTDKTDKKLNHLSFQSTEQLKNNTFLTW